jgi:hypothetical protein
LEDGCQAQRPDWVIFPAFSVFNIYGWRWPIMVAGAFNFKMGFWI